MGRWIYQHPGPQPYPMMLCPCFQGSHTPHPNCLPGENMSGLKRMSKAVLLMEPTALHALWITSRLRGSAVEIA
jgi:hypothetical protein